MYTYIVTVVHQFRATLLAAQHFSIKLLMGMGLMGSNTSKTA